MTSKCREATSPQGSVEDERGALDDSSGFDIMAPNGVGYLPVTYGEIGRAFGRVIDGHVLQAFLGSDVDFQAWFMGAVTAAGLKRNLDYQRAGPARVDRRTGRSGVNVIFSIRAAQKISLMARGPHGKAIRRYYLEQERRHFAKEPLLPLFIPRS